MSSRGHIRIFLTATVVWAGFLVLGLPSYYQQYSNRVMIWFDLILLIPITAFVYFALKRRRANRRMTLALWLAFYFTVPLAIYDWLYCGLYLGHGMQFIVSFWYLSIYYVIPWILFPLVALVLNQRSLGQTEN